MPGGRTPLYRGLSGRVALQAKASEKARFCSNLTLKKILRQLLGRVVGKGLVEPGLKPRPVPARPWVCLASRCDVAVTGHPAQRRKGPCKSPCQAYALVLLLRCEGPVIHALELHPDREVVAARLALKGRHARVPGALVQTDKLVDSPGAINEEVR